MQENITKAGMALTQRDTLLAAVFISIDWKPRSLVNLGR